MLVGPDFHKPFILVSDASGVRLGAILSQLDEEGHKHPMQYICHGLRGSKLEELAITWAVKIFRPYLLGRVNESAHASEIEIIIGYLSKTSD